MLRAINEKNENCLSFEKIDKSKKFHCPRCSNEVIFVDAILRIKHFRHKVESNCEPEPETLKHIEMKHFMLKKLLWENECLEVNLKFARPDLYKNNIAIEVQYSPVSYKDFIERTVNYRLHNIYVLWIFEWHLLKENVSDFLKKAHEIYFGRIYVYKNGVIFPVHLKSTGVYKRTINGELYWKYYKKKKKFLFGEKLCDFNLFTTKNNWKENNFNIAMFYDNIFWKNEN